jgi:hypothetical protein
VRLDKLSNVRHSPCCCAWPKLHGGGESTSLDPRPPCASTDRKDCEYLFQPDVANRWKLWGDRFVFHGPTIARYKDSTGRSGSPNFAFSHTENTGRHWQETVCFMYSEAEIGEGETESCVQISGFFGQHPKEGSEYQGRDPKRGWIVWSTVRLSRSSPRHP